MTEDAKQRCKFFLLRYSPNVVNGEFVNIGLVLLSPEAAPELRFSRDWSRVKRLDPQVDTELLDAFRDELVREKGAGLKAMLERINEAFSDTLQASESKACLATVPALEADELARIYLEAPHYHASREAGPRQRIWQNMQAEFQKAGVWQRMWREIPVSRYTRAGDPLEIDCGYRSDSTIKLFHATSLRTDVTTAKVLAFSYPDLAAGIQRIEKARPHLTAVIEDDLERNDQVLFALGTLEHAGVQVAPVSDLPDLAALAAREMASWP
jgi:hypothetical protein